MTAALRSPPHADAVPILELVHELAHTDGVGIRDPSARAALGGYASGKAARLARSLLAL